MHSVPNSSHILQYCTPPLSLRSKFLVTHPVVHWHPWGRSVQRGWTLWSPCVPLGRWITHMILTGPNLFCLRHTLKSLVESFNYYAGGKVLSWGQLFQGCCFNSLVNGSVRFSFGIPYFANISMTVGAVNCLIWMASGSRWHIDVLMPSLPTTSMPIHSNPMSSDVTDNFSHRHPCLDIWIYGGPLLVVFSFPKWPEKGMSCAICCTCSW